MPEALQAPPPRLAGTPSRGSTRTRRPGYEGVALALLAIWSLIPLAILFVRVGGGLGIGSGGRVFTGTDGPDVADQLAYISWIRDAGDHILFSNRFDLVADPHLFFHPMFALSGLAWKLGASLQLSFLAWKPVAVLVLFAGFAAYVRRMIPPGGWARPAALLVALFFFTPAAWLFDWAGIGGGELHFGLLVMALEMFPSGFVWGLWPLAIAVGLMPVFLLCLERALEPSRRHAGHSAGWYVAAAAAAGAVTSWIHPWQGLTLLVLTAGLIAWGRLWRRTVLAVPLAATLAPIAYYVVLAHTDSSWSVVANQRGHPHLGSWVFLALAPPLILAAVGVPGRVRDLQERAVRLWPLAALVVYFALDAGWIYHAFAGLSLPLAVLGVRGWRRLRVPAPVAVAAVAALTLPGMAFFVQKLRETANDHFLDRGEAAAMAAVGRSSTPGGILTTDDLGRAVPAFAGRGTWVGHATLTPNHAARVDRVNALFGGGLSPLEARAFVRGTGASFVLSGCGRPDLQPALGPLVARTRRFGCAVLYEIARARPPGRR